MRKRPKRPLHRRRCEGRIRRDSNCEDKDEKNRLGLTSGLLSGSTRSTVTRRVGESAMVPGGAALFQRVYTRLGCEGRPPRFRVEFYPYSSLVLTIRRREETAWVRFSDLLRRAPLSVLEGAAALLLSRVYRRRAPASLTSPYLEYARSDRTRERINHMRRRRIRPGAAGPLGRHFDLEKLFWEPNTRYFYGMLPRPHIGWSKPSSRRQVGVPCTGSNTHFLQPRLFTP